MIKTYKVLDNEKVNRVDVEVKYKKDCNPRGYYFRIIPYKHANRCGIESDSFEIFGPSMRECIMPVTRKSKGAEAKAIDVAKKNGDRWLSDFCNRNNYKLGNIIKEGD